MGSFNKVGFISKLPITPGDETVLIFLQRSKYASEYSDGCVYPGDQFKVSFLPIYGRYDDYGSIDQVVRDSNVSYIENYFGMDIYSVLRGSDVNSSVKNAEVLKNLSFTLEHKFIYDKIANYPIEKHCDGFNKVSKFFLNEFMSLDEVFDDSIGNGYSGKFILNSPAGDISIHHGYSGTKIYFEGVEKASTYSTRELIKSLSNIIGDNLNSELLDRYKNLSNVEYRYLVSKKISDSVSYNSDNLSDNELSALFNIDVNIITDSLRKSLKLLSSPDFKLDDGKRKAGEQFSYLDEHGESCSYKLNTHYGSYLFNDAIKDDVIKFFSFNMNISKNHLSYQMSDYGGQDTDWEFYYELSKIKMEYSKVQLDEYNKMLEEDSDYDDE